MKDERRKIERKREKTYWLPHWRLAGKKRERKYEKDLASYTEKYHVSVKNLEISREHKWSEEVCLVKTKKLVFKFDR
jgi:hypothetical protein